MPGSAPYPEHTEHHAWQRSAGLAALARDLVTDEHIAAHTASPLSHVLPGKGRRPGWTGRRSGR
jgi:hypothetical protein